MAKQDLNDRKKRKTCSFCADHVEYIDYKDAAKLKRYLTEAGKIMTCIRFWNLKAESYRRSLTQENEKILENTDFTENQFGVFYESL